MSLDIDWSLLASLPAYTATPAHSAPGSPGGAYQPSGRNARGLHHPTYPFASSELSPAYSDHPAVANIAHKLVHLLNKQLEAAKRPSFLGPVSVTEFDFGDIGPEVEIRDVGDIWQTFENDADDSSDEEPGEASGTFDDLKLHPDAEGGHTPTEDWDASSYAKYEQRRRKQQAQSGPSRGGRSVADQYNGGEDWTYVNRRKAKAQSNGTQASFRQAFGPDMRLRPRRTDEDDIDEMDEEDPADPIHEDEDDRHGDTASVAFSVFSNMMEPRPGIGLGSAGMGIGLGAGMSVNLAGSATGSALGLGRRMGGSMIGSVVGIGPKAPLGHARTLQSQAASAPQRDGATGGLRQRQRTANLQKQRESTRHMGVAPSRHRPQADHFDTNTRHRASGTPDLLSPSAHSMPLPSPDPPADKTLSSLPSLQLLLHLSHAPNIHLTLMTSLQINYPSPAFMSLPLKISITGFTLSADIVIAFDGNRKRVHLCLIDEYDAYTPSPGLSRSHSTILSQGTGGPSMPVTPGSQGLPVRPIPNGMAMTNNTGGPSYGESPKPIGQRLLPNLHIESEIGHADAHVLRNVGKVEKFITDVVRKTMVDELVFPNYHTVAL